MIERIFDRPRIMLPGPAGGIVVNAGLTVAFHFEPVIQMQGPWWLGMLACEELNVQELCFGNTSVFAGQGTVPSHCFDVRKPERLIPFQAPAVTPGNRIRIELYNWSCVAVQTTLVIWGNSVEPTPNLQTGPTIIRRPTVDVEIDSRPSHYWR